MINKIISLFLGRFSVLETNVIEANNIGEVKKHFNWKSSPVYERADIHEYNYIEDINQRRVRDAEVVATVVCNLKAKTILEVGTSTGMMTLLMAKNAPKSHVYTINIPPEDIINGKGGVNTTILLEKTEIGREYKRLGLKNITQIYENTATWQPNIGEIDVAFIDGCHDADFVYSDTVKILENMTSGSYIMWHDFNPRLRKNFHWINDVCNGVEKLYKKGHLTGRIILLKNSWVGLYKVP